VTWTEGTIRFGAFGRAADSRPFARSGIRVPNLDRPAPGEWLVVFAWHPDARQLRMLELASPRDGEPMRRYSAGGAVRPFEEGREWAAPLLPRIRDLLDF
jgi:hypothetical protein